MFTGLVADVGEVRGLRALGRAARLRIAHRLPGEALARGESVSVDGCCLTVVEPRDGAFEADLSPETLARTGGRARWRRGRRVNLERALAVGDRLGGHIVQGHVDDTTRLLNARREGGGSYTLRFGLPLEGRSALLEKGSVALDGISLTVSRVGTGWFEVAVIPETWATTTLADRRVGERLNLEYDVLARYAAGGAAGPGRARS